MTEQFIELLCEDGDQKMVNVRHIVSVTRCSEDHCLIPTVDRCDRDTIYTIKYEEVKKLLMGE